MGSSNFTVQLYCFNSIKMYYLIVSIVIGSVVGEPVTVCRPTDERYFIADSVQCDRFHMCDEQGNLAAEFLCQDGLVYEPISKQCGLPDTCDQFIDCTSGVERLVTCQNHLVFDDQTGDCEHPDTANRAGCTAEEH